MSGVVRPMRAVAIAFAVVVAAFLPGGLAGAGGLSGPAVAADVETAWPELTPGLWQFTRTLHAADKPTTIKRQACVDPVGEWKKQQETSARAGCEMTTTKVAADRFETLVQCDLPNVGAGRSRSVAVIRSADAYEVTVENEGVLAKTGAREHLIAERLGDCPK